MVVFVVAFTAAQLYAMAARAIVRSLRRFVRYSEYPIRLFSTMSMPWRQLSLWDACRHTGPAYSLDKKLAQYT